MLKEIWISKGQKLEDTQYVKKILDIEKQNLEIEASKFHQSIAKANEKMKRVIFLKYIHYYLNHIQLSEEELEHIYLSSDERTYLNLLIMEMRVRQIEKFIQPNFDFVKDIDKFSNKDSLIGETCITKYQYHQLEKKELEQIQNDIDTQMKILSSV